MFADSYELRPVPVAKVTPDRVRPPIEDLNQDVILSIAKAGACYPILLLLLTLPLLLPQISIKVLAFLVTFAIFVGLFGAIYALFVGSISMLLVYAFVTTLNLKVRAVPYGVAIGGIAGFSSLAMPFIAEVHPLAPGQIAFFFCGPVMAMVCGQIGGVLGARRFESRFPFEGSMNRERPRWQFGLRQLLVITAWVCGALAVLKTLGVLDTPHAVFVICLGGVLQAATYLIGKLIVATCVAADILELGPPSKPAPVRSTL